MKRLASQPSLKEAFGSDFPIGAALNIGRSMKWMRRFFADRITSCVLTEWVLFLSTSQQDQPVPVIVSYWQFSFSDEKAVLADGGHMVDRDDI